MREEWVSDRGQRLYCTARCEVSKYAMKRDVTTLEV
jgi:hypothetical protein